MGLLNDDNLRVLPHIIFYLSSRRPQLIGNPGHAGPGFFPSKNGLDISKPLVAFLGRNTPTPLLSEFMAQMDVTIAEAG